MRNRRVFSILTFLALIAMIVPPGVTGFALGKSASSGDAVVNFTILHTNDFHGNLQPAGSNPGMARVATKINEIRGLVGAENTLLLDAGDIMQGTLLSNLFKGESTIDVYNFVGYDVATFGNHEFDWSQTTLISRTTQADFPFVSANIVISDTGDCATAGWQSPSFTTPWITKTVGTAPNQAIVGIIGVTTQETPYITLAGNTAGLCFKDPAESISHYYTDLVNAGVDVFVVLSHIGYTDGGYGYGFPVYGDQTLAVKLTEAGTPVDLIIGGHSHTNLTTPTIPPGTNTTVVQAYYAGRRLGQADISVDTDTNAVTITWIANVIDSSITPDAPTQAQIDIWANDPWYQEQINRVVGFTNVEIVRDYNGDSEMGKFINDSIYNDLNTDAEPANDVDMVFNNAGGLRADITFPPTTTLPVTLTHGMLYNVLPFGNATVVGEMTGAQILELLNQSATLFKGAIQVAGIRFTFYCYGSAAPCTNPYGWGAYDVQVWNRGTSTWDDLVLDQTYRIATNEFLAPAGQDGFIPFKYVTDITYWGDMLDGVERWVSEAYTVTSPYSGTVDGRIARNGTELYDPTDPTQIIPVTILHHNDSHGNTDQGAYVGYTQLATLINQERAENPDRTLLLNAGDSIQGDAMAYYFKYAFTGFGADGITLPITMTTNPIIAEYNAMNYTAMTLGNHEFNYGNYVFTGTLGQATFPILGANIIDDGRYGLADVGVQPYITVTVPGPSGDIEIAILGISNHRVPNYELPSNIPGLTFTNPISEALTLVPGLDADNDAVVALTHIGFTTNPASVEVDNNVDTYMAATVNGIDAIIGGHSHTNPDPTRNDASRGDYKYLPAIVGDPLGDPVIINQAYRYNNTLGEVILGFLPDGLGGYDLITRAGTFLPVATATPEDPIINDLITPYTDWLNTYVNTPIGWTLYPLDALAGYTQETNAANLQADSAVWELTQHGIDVDFYLSGAMSNRKVADLADPHNPFQLIINHMFSLMPYENSLVTLSMNGPQLKTILERAYRNYYYYKYVPGYGGYSYYTTCMLDINSGGQITYHDTYPALPDGDNVISLVVNGEAIDFADAATYYHVATVNYLAAGSCNFNDDGVTLWPLAQIEHDTQYYVRDAVIHYIMDRGTIWPTIEGRLVFSTAPTYFMIMPFVFQDSSGGR
jgi:2',3'-cyclic-nucleotide 2'-phosphodiesterase (5'-nucleotidase family)